MWQDHTWIFINLLISKLISCKNFSWCTDSHWLYDIFLATTLHSSNVSKNTSRNFCRCLSLLVNAALKSDLISTLNSDPTQLLVTVQQRCGQLWFDPAVYYCSSAVRSTLIRFGCSSLFISGTVASGLDPATRRCSLAVHDELKNYTNFWNRGFLLQGSMTSLYQNTLPYIIHQSQSIKDITLMSRGTFLPSLSTEPIKGVRESFNSYLLKYASIYSSSPFDIVASRYRVIIFTLRLHLDLFG